jgi:hypothetical protein
MFQIFCKIKHVWICLVTFPFQGNVLLLIEINKEIINKQPAINTFLPFTISILC